MPRFAWSGYGSTRSAVRIAWFGLCGRPERWFLALSLILCLSTYLAAQDVNVHIQPRPAESPKPAAEPDTKAPDASTDPGLKANHGKPYMVDVDLVLVPVTVTDDWNRIVTGLDKENFAIMEGNEPQQVRTFSSEDAPISLGVILDMSGSMSDKIQKAREAVVEFMKTANPLDEFFMITFNDRPQLRADFTKSIEDVQGKLVYTVPQGSTALLDAIYMGINKMKDAHNAKKALLIISDGGDNHSRYTEHEIKSMVKEADVQIYAIGIFTMGVTQPEEVAGPLRNQYVIGYRPNNRARDGRWRKIKVKLIPPKGLPHLNVYSKTGYYAPSQ
jgi:Ca-activated chloride channel family protein